MGGTDFDDFPAEAVALPDVATYQGVVMEQVVDLEPDLVLAAGNFFTPPDDIARMRELGYPVVVVYAPDVPAVLADIELIGTRHRRGGCGRGHDGADGGQTRRHRGGRRGDGQHAAHVLRDRLGAGDLRPGPRLVRGRHGRPWPAASPSPPAIRPSSPSRSRSSSTADPEVIVLGDANYGVCPADVAARPGWGDMTAVVNGDIRPVDDMPVTRPGPRLAQGLASLARAIHPELELPTSRADPVLCGAG